jgi:hypothetical protein
VSGLKARGDGRRETPGLLKVLKERRPPRRRGRMGTGVKMNAPPIALASPPTRRARRASCRGSSGASRAAAASCTAPRRSARGGVSRSVDDADEGGREGGRGERERISIHSFVRYASARGGRRIHRSGDFSSETSSNDARARRRRRRRRRGDATDDDDDARRTRGSVATDARTPPDATRRGRREEKVAVDAAA